MTATILESLAAPTREDAMNVLQHGRVIGCGSYRTVYWMDQSPWVYKVMYPGDSSQNRREVEAREIVLPLLPEGVAIPQMFLIPRENDNGWGTEGDIVAARFVDGQFRDSHYWGCDDLCHASFGCWKERLSAAVRMKYARDLGGDNCIISRDGMLWLIDLGNFAIY